MANGSLFTSNKEGQRNLCWRLADGSGGLERLATSQFIQLTASWSPDGQILAFSEVAQSTGYGIWTLRLSDRKAQPFLQSQFNESAARFSPDGHWLAYTSDESGRVEVYVQPFPGDPAASGKSLQRVAGRFCGTGNGREFCFTATATR